jgi:hypothetical protein
MLQHIIGGLMESHQGHLVRVKVKGKVKALKLAMKYRP